MIANATTLFETEIVTEKGENLKLTQCRAGDPTIGINKTWWELVDYSGKKILCLSQQDLKSNFPARISREELNDYIVKYFTDYCNKKY